MYSSRSPQPTAPSTSADPNVAPAWLADAPRLRALIAGPDGAEILSELLRLVERQQQRAPRYGKPMFARLRAEGAEDAEVVVLRDISASGVRLQLPTSAQLDLLLAHVWIEVRVPGSPPLELGATLVRVAAQRENGTELAFQFSDESRKDPRLHALLAHLARQRTGNSNAPGGR
ncbi:MAG: hypothetical protein RL685_2755 [Pseudomonadota bacterium]